MIKHLQQKTHQYRSSVTRVKVILIVLSGRKQSLSKKQVGLHFKETKGLRNMGGESID